MHIVFALEPAEIQAAVRVLMRPALRRAGALLAVLTLGAAVLVALRLWLAALVLLCVMALLGALAARMVLLSRSNLRQSYARMGTAEYWFDGSGVRTRSPAGEFFLPWTAFAGYRHSPELTVLQQAGGAVLVIPHRATTVEQQQWLQTAFTGLWGPGR